MAGTFSVSESSVEAVTAISDQAEHHHKFSSQEELRALLKRHRVAFDVSTNVIFGNNDRPSAALSGRFLSGPSSRLKPMGYSVFALRATQNVQTCRRMIRSCLGKARRLTFPGLKPWAVFRSSFGRLEYAQENVQTAVPEGPHLQPGEPGVFPLNAQMLAPWATERPKFSRRPLSRNVQNRRVPAGQATYFVYPTASLPGGSGAG
jgi:hypothetical protein